MIKLESPVHQDCPDCGHEIRIRYSYQVTRCPSCDNRIGISACQACIGCQSKHTESCYQADQFESEVQS